MTSSSTDIIRPNYMEKFRCIGGACEDSCCAGWRVVFDKRTAQTYLNAKDPEIREIATKSIKKIKTDRSSQHYSRIEMDPQTGACPFQQTDKLCMVQSRLGESALSKVCSTYPRISGGVAGRYIEVATLSCPEAARLCLLEPEAMKVGDRKVSSSDQTSFYAAQQTLNPLRFLHQSALEMLEDERVSIMEFALVYGTALNMIRKRPKEAFNENSRFDDMQQIITLVRKGLADTQSATLQAQASIQFQLGKILPILIRYVRNNLLKNRRFRESVFDGLNGLQLDPSNLSKSVNLYSEAIARFSPADHTLMSTGFRNYLINELLKNAAIYVNSAEDAFRGLQAAITRLSIIAVQVVGARCLHPDCILAERLPFTVSSTARTFEHNQAIMLEIADYLNAIEDRSVAVLGLITPRF